MRTLLLVDFSNTVYRAVHVHRFLSFAGKPTGGLFGFVQQVCSEVVRSDICAIFTCGDSPPYLRAQEFEQFKASRKRNSDPAVIAAMMAAKKQVTDFLEDAELPFWRMKGMEADDLLYYAAASAEEFGYDRVVIKSGDSDLYQLFALNIPVVIARGTASAEHYTHRSFSEEYGITPKQWPQVLALAGSHNGTPGVPGIGPKRAIKIIKEGTFGERLRSDPMIEQCYRLCKLPYKPLEEVQPVPLPKPFSLKRRSAEKYLSRFGIQISPTIRRAFDQLS